MHYFFQKNALFALDFEPPNDPPNFENSTPEFSKFDQNLGVRTPNPQIFKNPTPKFSKSDPQILKNRISQRFKNPTPQIFENPTPEFSKCDPRIFKTPDL